MTEPMTHSAENGAPCWCINERTHSRNEPCPERDYWLAVEDSEMPEPCLIPPGGRKSDYLLDGSPESVALVREARGLPPLTSDSPPAADWDTAFPPIRPHTCHIELGALYAGQRDPDCAGCRCIPPGTSEESSDE